MYEIIKQGMIRFWEEKAKSDIYKSAIAPI